MIAYKSVLNGGGSGGGHTIEDSDGTDLTQRDTLQFGEGFIADDDSTNEKTVITPDVMQSSDMDDVVDVYPQAGNLVSIVNAFNRGDLYSTEEKMVGQYVDGKPLYQKTIDCGALPNSSDKTVAHNISNIDIMVSCKGFAYNSSSPSSMFQLPHLNTQSQYVVSVDANRTNISFNTGMDRSSYNKAIITIQYTKTTDTAISIGEATEYSTTEKVVGTWIDGKPVFQRVLTSTAQISLEVNTWASSEFSIANVDVIVDAGIIDTGGNRGQIWCGHNGDTLLLLSNRTNSWVAGAHLIVQYTKTT